MKTIKGIILDVDGTLVDSNDAHAQAWVTAFTEAGYHVSFEKVRRLIGMGSDKLLPEVIGKEKDSPEGKQISERRGQIFKEQYMPNLQAFEGVKALLEHFRKDGYKLTVASSAQSEELESLLKIAGAKEFLEDTTSANDAKNSKPEPDIIQAALNKSGLKADEVIMLGDTPYDVIAANKAKVSTVALRCGGWKDEDLKGAIEIYDNPNDLLKHYNQSIFAQQTN